MKPPKELTIEWEDEVEGIESVEYIRADVVDELRAELARIKLDVQRD